MLADDVGAVRRHADAGHNRRHTVDHDIAATTERVRTAHSRQSEDRQVAGGIGQYRTVELQRCGALEVQVSAEVASQHRVFEHQGVAARPALVNRIAIDQAGFQQQARGTTGEIDVDDLVEDHVDQHFVADFHRTIQALRGNAGNPRIGRNHPD
ncbi:hypothetical protein PS3A_16320 [Pseudomonas sp. 3A(2025)]